MEYKYIHLKTNDTSYVLAINKYGHLENLYYGAKLALNEDLSILVNKQTNMQGTTTVYSGEPHDTYSLDFVNLELGTIGKGDYRRPSILLEHELGFASDFVVKKHGFAGREVLLVNDLPIPHGYDEYFYVILEDNISKVKVQLDYLIFKRANVIARRLVVLSGKGKLTKAASLNLDLNNDHFDVFSTYGTWANEVHASRNKLVPGLFEVATSVGPSSNRHNPFILLLNEKTDLHKGIGYGVNLIYSGPFKASVELTFDNRVRLQHGINDETFSKELDGKPFITPFAALTFSDKGENGLSQNFHRFVIDHVVRYEYARKPRPILLNNWEATYLTFDEAKIKKLMREASKLGIELMVLDDGWFINRDDDFGGLGNYEVNKKKLPRGLKGLSDYATKLGMSFGLWFEPEMVSADHPIFTEHPEWVVKIPGVKPSTGRHQYSLNLTLKEVQDYIVENVSKVLKSADIKYVKWDYNRNLSDYYSPSGEYGTFFYDYTLGLYAIMQRLTKEFPTILWEGCASGGNRFDLGILSFFDQIWVSDCSDAYERIRMHTNLAKAYPLSVMSGHVSAAPNHQLLRDLPLQTRFNNAFMSGGFGYELDVNNLTPKDKKEIKAYNEIAKAFRSVIMDGKYYELTLSSAKDKKAYALLSEASDNALLLISSGIHSPMPEVLKFPSIPVKEDLTYEVFALPQSTDISTFGSLLNMVLPKFIKHDGTVIKYLDKRSSAEELVKVEVIERYTVSGKALRAGALTLYPEWTASGFSSTTRMTRDFTSVLYFITKKD